MKKHLLAAVSLAALTGSSFAADLPSRKEAVLPPPSMWTGFYAGLNAGYNFGTNDNITSTNYGLPWARIDGSTTNPNVFTPNWVSAAGPVAMNGNVGGAQSGFMGGLQAGYNYQWNPNFVVGIETDIQGSGTRGAANTAGAAAFPANFTVYQASSPGQSVGLQGQTSVDAGLDYLGTLRGRIGYLLTPTTLVYGSGGFAYGGAYAKVSQNAIDALYDNFPGGGCTFCVGSWRGGGNQNRLLVGWTAGGGLEWMFMQNWSLKAEALYWNLGSMNVNTALAGVAPDPQAEMPNNAGGGRTSVNYQGVVARAGINYHFNFSPAPGASSSLASLLASPLATDLPSRKGGIVPQTAIAWQGVYAGLNAGYNFGTNENITSTNYGLPWARIDGTVTNPNVFTPNWVPAAGPVAMNGNVGATQSGFMGGLQAGYNYQWSSNVIAGLETDIQGSGTRGSTNTAGAARFPANFVVKDGTSLGSSTGLQGQTSVNAGIDYLGTLRGRIGYLFTPNTLIYGTGGFAYGGAYAKVDQNAIDVLADNNGSGCSFCVGNWRGGGNQNQLLVGWTAGGGVEWMFMQNWSLKAEALYWNLGNMNVNTALSGVAPDPETEMANNAGWGRTSVNYQGVVARAGINYHFNLASTPVVAKF